MRRISKPIGLYLISIFVVVAYGVFPLLAVYTAIRDVDGRVPFTIVFISFLLPAFSIASAIWAFVGDNEGRIALLVLVSLNFLWWTFLAINEVAYSQSEGFDAAMFLIRMIRPLVFFVLFWWYLTRKDVVAYFSQEQKPN